MSQQDLRITSYVPLRSSNPMLDAMLSAPAQACLIAIAINILARAVLGTMLLCPINVAIATIGWVFLHKIETLSFNRIEEGAARTMRSTANRNYIVSISKITFVFMAIASLHFPIILSAVGTLTLIASNYFMYKECKPTEDWNARHPLLPQN